MKRSREDPHGRVPDGLRPVGDIRWHGIDITVTALCGASPCSLTGVLNWEDVKSERAAWDIFIWYGGLLRLGKALNDTGVTTEFAKGVGASLLRRDVGGSVRRRASDVLLRSLRFRQHHGPYARHVSRRSWRCWPRKERRSAWRCTPSRVSQTSQPGLTNYGTTPAPMFFAQGYVSLSDGGWSEPRRRWSTSLIWSTIGFTWWKLLGIW